MSNHDQRIEWLQQVKAGDEVVLHSRSQQSCRKISRVTAKQVFVSVGDFKEYEQAFWKRNGQEVGMADTWRGSCISMPNPEIKQEMLDRDELRKLREWLANSQFSLIQLRTMKSAFDACNAQLAPAPVTAGA